MENADKYLLDIGFDESNLPELFNDDDKSVYTITELMEGYHQAKLKLLNMSYDAWQRELLCAFFKFFRDNGESNIGLTIEEFVDMFLENQKTNTVNK